MSALSGSLLSTALALAAALAAIALFVSILQEVYKHLTKSKSRSYKKVLVDTLGPWVAQAEDRPSFVDLTVRGPFQWLRRRPSGVLLPMSRADLTTALERTTPTWQRRALRAIREEAERQDGTPAPPTRSWTEFLDELTADAEASGDVPSRERPASGGDHATVGLPSAAGELLDFLGNRDIGPGAADLRAFDARRLAIEFQQHFMPHVLDAGARHPRILQNFEYAYQRRNLRQSFVFGLLVAIGANLPLDRLYSDASKLTPEQSAALAEQVMGQYETLQCDQNSDAPGCPDARTLRGAEIALRTALCGLEGAPADSTAAASAGSAPACPTGPTFRIPIDQVTAGFGSAAGYLFWCALTALLVSFGAPFWHNIVSALARAGGRRGVPEDEGKKGGE